MAAGDLITQDWQIELRGTLLGNGTAFKFARARIQGLGVPAPTEHDQQLEHAAGLYQGRDYTGTRILTFAFIIVGEDADGRSNPDAAVTTFRQLCVLWRATGDEAEQAVPLHMQIPGFGRVKVTGRPRGLVDELSLADHGVTGALATFVCDDPTLYFAPGAPTITGLVPSGGQVTLTWTAPPDPGSSAITGYNVYRYTNGVLDVITGPLGVVTSTVVSGLTNGVMHQFRVAAINASGGVGKKSAARSMAAATVPAAPSGSTGAGAENGAVNVFWGAPASNGGSPVTGYWVTVFRASDNVQVSPNHYFGGAGTLAGVVTGLTYGVAVYFKVQAENNIGLSAVSANSPTVTPVPLPPGAPIINTAMPGVSQVIGNWTAPTTGGPVVTYNMEVRRVSDGVVVSSGSTAGLTGTLPATNGVPVYVYVSATNASGTGPFSTNSNAVTPANLPGAPTIGTATNRTFTWTAPASDGGSPITLYNVTVYRASDNVVLNEGHTSGQSGLSLTFPSLQAGVAVYGKVRASNAVGYGPQSAASNTVTPS